MGAFDLKNKYNAIAVIGGSGLIVAILIGAVLIRPAWGKLKTVGAEIPVEQQKRDQAEADSKNLEKAKEFFSKEQAAVEQINTAVPVQPSVPNILVILESLAKQNGVFLTSFAPQQISGQPGGSAQAPASGSAPVEAAPGGVNSIEITAQYRGSYTALINYFYSLERSLRIVDVKTLSVSSSQTGGAIEGNITFRAYYKSVGAPAAATPAPGGTR